MVIRTETDRGVGTGAGMMGGSCVHLSPVTADILKRVFCPFRLSRRSQRYSICLPSRPLHLILPHVLSPPPCVFPSLLFYPDWLTVPSHVTRSAQVPLCWKLDTTHPLHLHPTSPTVQKKKTEKPTNENTNAYKHSMEIQCANSASACKRETMQHKHRHRY